MRNAWLVLGYIGCVKKNSGSDSASSGLALISYRKNRFLESKLGTCIRMGALSSELEGESIGRTEGWRINNPAHVDCRSMHTSVDVMEVGLPRKNSI